MTTLALTLLGTLRVDSDDRPIRQFQSDKVRALLAYLATEADRPHARASLAALLWPEQPNAAALRNLSQTLVRLREVLGHTNQQPAPLHVTTQSIQWQLDQATVDVADFARLAQSSDPRDLARATELYQGEFLAGFALPGCEAFEEWLLLAREHFHHQALIALHALAEHDLATQRWAEAADAARRQIELDRWREDAHRQLIRALAGTGDRAAALAAYQRCEQILHDDLNIAPDDATIALAAMIRSGAVAGSIVPTPIGPPASQDAELRPNLPAPLSALIGRESELAQIEALLRQDDTRLVTILGVGGAGKTRLALAAAWALRDAFAAGVGWVSLAGIAPSADLATQADALATAIGAALGMPFDGRRAPIDELRRVVAGHDLLLVLDNCEHLSIASFIRDLLAAAPQLRVLATSRAQLSMAGEMLVRVEGLPLPDAGADDPQHYAGIQLFLERARRHVPEMGRLPADLAAIARLCRLLDGLPLAIELAARWVGHYTCDEIAAEIQSDLDFLAVHGGDTPERHHSLRAVFDYSWAMLREPERQALARLSVFRSTFDREAAQAIAATRVTTLAMLVGASLLRHLGVGRYGVHELVRQFAAARLVDRGEAEALAERHATYYLDLLAQQEPLLYGGAQQTAAAIIRDMADNLRQAWSWAVAHSAWDGIARSLLALRQYTAIDGLFYESAARVAEAAERIEAQITPSAPERVALLGRLRGTEAAFLERQEAREAAAAAARAGIASAAAAGDALGEAYAYLQVSNATVPYIASLAPREAAQAIGWLERAIALCRGIRDPEPRDRHFVAEVEISCLLKLSTIQIDLREYALACALAQQALALTQISGDRLQEARALSFLGMALENAGRYQAAYERRVTMLDLARANGSRPQEHAALNNLSCTLIYIGDYPAALEYAQAMLRISGEWMQNPYQNADSYHTLSWAACRAGETELALEAAQQALASARATNALRNQTLPLLALGDALHDLHRYDEAHAAYHDALALGSEQQTPQPVAVALAGMARCRMAQGALGEAQAAVEEILRGPDVLTLGSLWEPLRIAETCYRVLHAAGDWRAAELLRAAAALLDRQAQQIADPDRRRIFCEAVPAHRAILASVAEQASRGDLEKGRQADKERVALFSLPPDLPLSLSTRRGEAPAIAPVYGRQAELAQLERRLTDDRCQLIAVVGMGGVGKTTLATAAVNAAAAHFELVIWRSLLNAPPLEDVLREILQRLANQRLSDLPAGLDAQLALLIDELRQQRCLLVLDNLESILDTDRPGQMRPGYDGYAQLIEWIAKRRHCSCLLLTSREQPLGQALWEKDSSLVYTLSLGGLDVAAGRALLAAHGLPGGARDATALIERYSGNPLALKLVSQTVQELFGNDISAFLAGPAPIFDDIRAVLDQQFARLSALEQELLIWLAIEREPILVHSLRDNLIGPRPLRAVLEAVRALQRRSLIEQNAQGCTLQNVVIEYLTDLLVEQVGREIAGNTRPETGRHADGERTHTVSSSPDRLASLSGLNRYALLKATAKEYVRASQQRLIVEPIAQHLVARLGRAQVVERLSQILADLRAQPAAGYAAGNMLNLMLHLQLELRGYDFSGLHIRQAYLQGAALPDVNFREAQLSHTVFTHVFGEILAIQFDREQQLLVAGVTEGKLCLWRAADSQLLREYQTFGANATIATFSPDGRVIVTGDTDHQVRLWDIAHGRLVHSLPGHAETPWALMLSPDGTTLASGGADGVVHLWDVPTGRLRQTLRNHTMAVPALAFTIDGQILASGDIGGTISIWRVGTPEPLHTLHGHTDEVHILVFGANGATLASGSHDRTIGLWDVERGQLAHRLKAHTEVIRTLAISSDGRTLASGGGDEFVCLWDVRSGQALYRLLDLANRINHMCFSANGQTLATVNADQTVELWDVVTGRRMDSLQTYSNVIYSIDFSPDGEQLASSGTDSIARVWNISASSSADPHSQEQPARTLQGHTSWIFSVAYSPDGAILASAGRDRSIRLWDVRSGRTIRALRGHTDDVEVIQFSPDGQQLLSASRDTTLRLWDVSSGQTIQILQGHTDRIHSCAFSPDGRLVASGSIDRTVRLWDVRAPAGQPAVHTLHGHTNAVRCVIFNPDGRMLASSAFDQTVRLWDTRQGYLLACLPAQNTITTSIAFHPSGALLATGAKDHTVRLWDIGSNSQPGGQPLSEGAARLRGSLIGHTNSVETVRFSPDGRLIASGSADETIRLWDIATGICQHTLRADRPYARLNIAGATGISAEQYAALIALGAVEAY